MKVVIISGGRGSENLQSGFKTMYGNLIDTSVIICAMDNGLSTGQCRQVYNGLLLGPSDLRKNQILKCNNKTTGRNASLLNFLAIRFTKQNSEVENYVQSEIAQIDDAHIRNVFAEASENFFNQTLSKVITYSDFSISNLIYAGLAGLNGNSLSAAGKIMAGLLDIPEDSVIVASDTVAYINAVTDSGIVLSDEVDIDEWDNADDRINELFFTNQHGEKIDAPVISTATHNALVNADIIVFSTGTQWTSLIPTYAMRGFKEALRMSKASKYLVMNNENDLDTVGYTSGEIQELLNRWLPMDSITTVFNDNASVLMTSSERSEKFPFFSEALSSKKSRNHVGPLLSYEIVKHHYGEYIDNISGLILDYDDTIVGRNNSFVKESEINKSKLKELMNKFNGYLAIVTGNSIRTIDHISPNMKVYADCGLNEYTSSIRVSDNRFETTSRYVKIGSVDAEYLLSNNEVDIIKGLIASCGIDMSKVTNKAQASIAIKPIVPEYREAIRQLIEIKISEHDCDTLEPLFVTVSNAGTTTIEISKNGVNKCFAVQKHLDETDSEDNILSNARPIKVTYLGDEGFGGNDECIREMAKLDERLKFLAIKNPRDTAIFLTTLSGTNVEGYLNINGRRRDLSVDA